VNKMHAEIIPNSTCVVLVCLC